MLKIRLQRVGKKKFPTYRLIVSEKTKDTQAGSLEILGIYQPAHTEKVIDFKKDRILHWISQGAQPSETVNNLLVNAGIIESKKQKSVTISNKRKGKLEEKAVAKKEAEEAAKAAAAEKAEAEKAAAEEAKEAAKAEAEAAEAKADEAEAPKEDAPAEDAAAEEKPKEEAEEKKEDAA